MPGGRGSRGQHGGQRTPANPAAVSGPGALSARTDGGPGQPIRVAPGGDYGDRQKLVGLQQAAPLAAAPDLPSAQGAPGAAAPFQPPPQPGSLTPLNAPTGRPGEPVTTGLPVGPGAGPEALDDVGVAAELRLMYAQTGSEKIRELIEALEEGR